MQSRRQSLVESWTNTGIGLIVNYTGGFIIYPLIGWNVSFINNMAVTVFFTLLSLARGYLVRRYFNSHNG